MRAALGYKKTGARENAEENGSPELPPFLAKNNLKPFISKDFTVRPISYQPRGRSVRTVGTRERPEWVAADVCAVLGLGNVTSAPFTHFQT